MGSDGIEARARTRWVLGGAEVATSVAVAVLFAWSCTTIRTDAMDRIGQVSGLASLLLRFSLFAIMICGGLVAAHRWRGGRWFEIATRFACAAVPGLLGGLLAGGVMIALQGTPFGIGGDTGDIRVLTDWAAGALAGAPPASGVYPPLQVEIIIAASKLLDVHPIFAIKPLQIAGVMLAPPAAYLAWRSILSPRWALAIGVTAALPLYDAYRPYPLLALILFFPLVVRFLDELRRAGETHGVVLARRGLVLGLGFGALFLLYSGWFQWSAPGFVVAALIVVPWRGGWKHAAVLCASSGLAFALVAFRYLSGIVAAPAIADRFVYFDTRVDPAYITMWRGDLPGVFEAPGMWPPLGELGGVGVFTLLLTLGFGLAISVGRTRTPVIAIVTVVVGAWLFRFWHAHRMWDTGLVQLYPRTTPEILHGLLLLAGLGGMYLARRVRLTVDRSALTIGMVPAMLLLYAFAGSALADRYMPRDLARDPGKLSWFAHHTPRADATQTPGATVAASSAHDDTPPQRLVDGDPTTTFTSALGRTDDHVEWIELTLPIARSFSKVVLYPAGEGFPVDFTIDVWDGARWVTRVTRANVAPATEPVVVPLGQRDRTNRIRIHVSELGRIGADRALRLAEIELLP